VTLADRLAETLRQLRQDADLTQKEMAKRLGLSIEQRGKRFPVIEE